MKRNGPDSLEGLFMLLICCLITTLMFGAAGLSSMLFVECITRYNTDRNNAAFPFTLSVVLQAVSGPFAGYFAKRIGVRAVVCTGSILAFIGIGTCFFAEDITTVTVLWGLVYGTGFGLSTLLLPVVVNDYFFKQRSKALGLCYLGSPIGFFLFPPIYDVLLNKYGLSGTLLFLAGINLHCIPLSMLLKSPKFKLKEENSSSNYGEARDSYLSTDSSTPDILKRLDEQFAYDNEKIKGDSRANFRRFSIEILWNPNTSPKTSSDGNKQYTLVLNKKLCNTFHSNTEMSRSYRKSNGNYKDVNEGLDCAKSDIFNPYEYELGDENSRSEVIDSKIPDIPRDLKLIKNSNCGELLYFPRSQNYEELSTIYFGTDQISSASTICLNNPPSYNNDGDVKNLEGNLHCYYNESYLESTHSSLTTFEVPTLISFRKVDGFSNYPVDKNTDVEKKAIQPPEMVQETNSLLKMYVNPVFILVCVINGIASLHFSTLTTVILDFSRDQEIDIFYEKYIMMCISLMGAFGMMGFGWVTDGGYMTRTSFSSLAQLIGCVCTSVLPFMSRLETLMVPLSMWCVCQASFIPQIPAIIAEHFKDDIQAVAVSACNVLSGPMYLIIPPLIGYFRDEKGSYDNIFYLMGSLSFVNSIALFIIPYMARWRAKS